MAHKLNLSETEYKIMSYLWTIDSPVTVTEVQKHFAEAGCFWAAQTVQTFLTRLVQKGALKRTTQGKHRYEPAMSSTEFASKYLLDTIRDNFGGSIEDFMVALRGITRELTKEQKQELKDLWNE